MSEIQECSQQEETEGGMSSNEGTDENAAKLPKQRKIPKTVSFHDFKAATSVLSAGCLKELKNIVRCSDFIVSDNDEPDDEPQNPPSEKGEDANKKNEGSVAQQDSEDDFEIRSMTTAALVISKGCSQELKKLVSCSDFPITDDDDEMDEEGEAGEVDYEEREKAEGGEKNDSLLSPNVHRKSMHDHSTSDMETEIEHLDIHRSRKQSDKQAHPQPKQQQQQQQPPKETSKAKTENKSEEKPRKEQPISVKVELHCPESDEREVNSKKEEIKNERRKSKGSTVVSEDAKPVMIYEPKRGSYKARKSISLNDFKSSTVVISNAGTKHRSRKTKAQKECQVLEDENEDDEVDDEKQQPVLREDENYYAECMSLAQSSSCVTLADQDGEENVDDRNQTLYETLSPYEDTSYMHTKGRRDKSSEREKKGKKLRHEDEYVVNKRGPKVERSTKTRDYSTQSNTDRRHCRAESETRAKKKEVSLDDMLKLVSGMLSEVTDSLERLNKCSEKSASMNNSPIQSPVPMRRKYRLLQDNEHINNKYNQVNQVRACNSLPRNFYPGCHHFRTQISDFSNFDSDGISSVYDNLPEPVVHAPCELHSRSDKLRVVLLKRKMYERYPQYFPDPPGCNWYDTGVNIVSYDAHQENTCNANSRSFREPCRYSNYYVEGIQVGKKSLEREYDICSNYYETVD